MKKKLIHKIEELMLELPYGLFNINGYLDMLKRKSLLWLKKEYKMLKRL